MKKGIPWTDETVNPVIGCSKISPGCTNCYAETMAKRLKAMGTRGYSDVVGKNGWTGETAFVESELEKPYRWKKPKKIFVGSMTDLFHESVPYSWVDKIFEMISENQRHVFQVLTKRAHLAFEYFDFRAFRNLPTPNNLWLGVTSENQEQADRRITMLLQISTSVRFLSIEPMFGPINLGGWLTKPQWGKPDKNNIRPHEIIGRNDLINWVICGGESGPNYRPMRQEWVRSIRDQCKNAGVPFFFKGWGSNKIPALLDGARHVEFPK